MNIGEASKQSGVSAKMIRYYEEIELIPRIARTYSGYRSYADADIHRLRFIRRARDLGFSVPEIQELLGLWDDRSRKSKDVRRLAKSHIEGLEQRIDEMQALVDILRNLIRNCAGDNRPDCPILADLERAN
ncbi:MAG: Cu(I)-responsive transcriptional regulator [Chthoniobacterales bacterium]